MGQGPKRIDQKGSIYKSLKVGGKIVILFPKMAKVPIIQVGWAANTTSVL